MPTTIDNLPQTVLTRIASEIEFTSLYKAVSWLPTFTNFWTEISLQERHGILKKARALEDEPYMDTLTSEELYTVQGLTWAAHAGAKAALTARFRAALHNCYLYEDLIKVMREFEDVAKLPFVDPNYFRSVAVHIVLMSKAAAFHVGPNGGDVLRLGNRIYRHGSLLVHASTLSTVRLLDIWYQLDAFDEYVCARHNPYACDVENSRVDLQDLPVRSQWCGDPVRCRHTVFLSVQTGIFSDLKRWLDHMCLAQYNNTVIVGEHELWIAGHAAHRGIRFLAGQRRPTTIHPAGYALMREFVLNRFGAPYQFQPDWPADCNAEMHERTRNEAKETAVNVATFTDDANARRVAPWQLGPLLGL
ncbi:hypothetical protein Dda_1506 [Drechslerella dactyloides]|uniref:Uncharacterized protein n=1 Tax=Drechslerella dactyloides TaxID=74499 RepID=A0AAD6J1V1_DREDA|nr:hypothetical protein Dda_1506 [Drechslerella dactyloides]